MSDTQQSRATLSRNFIAQQSSLSDNASCPPFCQVSNWITRCKTSLFFSNFSLCRRPVIGQLFVCVSVVDLCCNMRALKSLTKLLLFLTLLHMFVAQLCCMSDTGLSLLDSAAGFGSCWLSSLAVMAACQINCFLIVVMIRCCMSHTHRKSSRDDVLELFTEHSTFLASHLANTDTTQCNGNQELPFRNVLKLKVMKPPCWP